MKYKFPLFFLFVWQLGISQEAEKSHRKPEDPKPTYVKFDFSIPIIANEYWGESNPQTGGKYPLLLINGIICRTGIGSHHDKWIGLGINTGFDWKASECLVVVPVFGSLRISPSVSKNARINLETGFGRAMVISGNHLSGYFKKASLGIEDEESGLGLYLELCDYGFSRYQDHNIGSFSIGISYVMF